MWLLADDTIWTFLDKIPWVAWIPIVAILVGGIGGILRMNQRHRERMEMIRQGMNPGRDDHE
jgi:hypothetical protein